MDPDFGKNEADFLADDPVHAANALPKREFVHSLIIITREMRIETNVVLHHSKRYKFIVLTVVLHD